MLAAAFVDGVPEPDRARWQACDLEPLLERVVATARDACPGVSVDERTFVRYLGERAGDATEAWLLELPAGDLYLACGCAIGNTAALALLEQRHVPAIEAIVRSKLTATLADEALQRVREHLFVGADAHIRDYSGRGELGKWLAITAVRAGLRILRETRREVAADDGDLGHLVDTSGDAELQHLRARYREDFKLAFADAFAELAARDRNLLRASVLDGKGIDAIGELHGIHRSTASRWLAAAREELIKRTKAALRARLQISPAEVESILKVLADQVDVTLEGLLRATRS
jgi:RNA polymerase sigma-70 factor, ECF subfamily